MASDPASNLRREAAELRALAADQADPELREELLELARRCEQLANHIAGNGKETRR
jgi:hypothetical protein